MNKCQVGFRNDASMLTYPSAEDLLHVIKYLSACGNTLCTLVLFLVSLMEIF